jgi:hypothetical protein
MRITIQTDRRAGVQGLTGGTRLPTYLPLARPAVANKAGTAGGR